MQETSIGGLVTTSQDLPDADPYSWIQDDTRTHRARHGCGAYTFADGRLLLALARDLRPERVLELGTAHGYSACCWADAGAQVDTIDMDAEHVDSARANIARAHPAGVVTVHPGRFDQVLPNLPGSYDIGFFDGFAPTPALLAALVARVARPGLLVVANVTLAGAELAAGLARIPHAEHVALSRDVTAVALSGGST